MNTVENLSTPATSVTTKRGRGRPVNPNAVRVLHVNAEGKVHGRGPAPAGFTKIYVHRKVKSADYVHGTTPILPAPAIAAIV